MLSKNLLIIFIYLLLNFGLKASFNPSPIRAIANTIIKIANPGKVTVHQASKKKSRE